MTNLQSFNSSYPLIKTMFNVEISKDDFEEIGLIGWDIIGNRKTRMYRYSENLNGKDMIYLPCNCDIIESVTHSYEDYQYLNNTDSNMFNNKDRMIEQFSEQFNSNTHRLYQPGKFINYERVGNMLLFKEKQGVVNILYHGIIADDEGLPCITDKEAIAIATFCAYSLKKREGYSTNNGNILQVAQMLGLEWDKAMRRARAPYYLDQNTMDQILNARTNWNRKTYGVSYKPVK